MTPARMDALNACSWYGLATKPGDIVVGSVDGSIEYSLREEKQDRLVSAMIMVVKVNHSHSHNRKFVIKHKNKGENHIHSFNQNK